MKILVFSDSHSSVRFMFRCVRAVKPDTMIHLGDYFDDGMTLRQEFPHIKLYQVPGNCDGYRCPPGVTDIDIRQISGVNLYLTHGHKHRVKSGLGALLKDARACGVDAVLYGHTHQADCRLEDGLWILNPGACGCYGGSAGLIEISDGRIQNIRILKDEDLLKLE